MIDDNELTPSFWGVTIDDNPYDTIDDKNRMSLLTSAVPTIYHVLLNAKNDTAP